MKNIFYLLLPLILINSFIYADIKLPSIISNGMILQQKSNVNIWGWASPGEKITLKASWTKTSKSTIADEYGKWSIKIMTGRAGGPYNFILSGKNTIKIDNVLFGEVWFCSGQSNMEFTIRMLGGWEYYQNEKKDIESNDYSKIRICNITKNTSPLPLDTCQAKWSVTNVQNALEFSGTAFFYGMELFKKLKVPIGLITSSWGGTPAQSWTAKEYLQKEKELQYYTNQEITIITYPTNPSFLYNAMIFPIRNFTIKGVIWYQGEANRHEADLYYLLFTTMIKNWRAVWNQGDFPFYFVQIAPFGYTDFLGSSGFLREAQLKTTAVKNTGMAVTLDIGNLRDIHPKNKQEVGRRLALWALSKTYNLKVPAITGPIYRNLIKEGNKIKLFFDEAKSGLSPVGKNLSGFTIAGEDMIFKPAKATIEKENVIVYNEKINDPIAVRYAFGENDTATLFNKNGLPASSFRTDDKPFFFRKVSSQIFIDSIQNKTILTLKCNDKQCDIRYTINGTEPIFSSQVYKGNIMLDKSTEIKARAFKNDFPSNELTEILFTMHKGFGKKANINVNSKGRLRNKTSFLLNGIQGSLNYGDGNWIGIEASDMNLTIDLLDTFSIKNINFNFLQDANSWIFLPEFVEISVSKDSINFEKAIKIIHSEPLNKEGAFIKTFKTDLQGQTIRFLNIKAKNIETCPPWHRGAGGKAWIYIDEVVIE